jgi:hypothetical protein
MGGKTQRRGDVRLSTVTRAEVKEQIDRRIRDNRRIISDETAYENILF